MAMSLVQSHDKSNNQAKVLAPHTHTIKDYDEKLMSLTTRIALPTRFVPFALVPMPGVNHEFHLRRD